ncbi:hypothetical protein P12x_003689 [Tundrisphaera lichenicola]|uniref:hypothetical protein n=1 Tax=Tundrisphaera lichenicola TaxID=2029860 RepID=UPI003EC12CE6
MNTNGVASLMGGFMAKSAAMSSDGVVEIGLLLPSNRADALMKLAKERQETVGQILRKLIDRELTEPA